MLATGYNVVNVDAARERGIAVTNIPAYSTPSVVQAVFALLLELTNRTALHDAAVHAGDWVNCRDFTFRLGTLIELDGLTMGIVGMGQTGQAVAGIARGFGMHVMAWSRTLKQVPGVTWASDLDSLLRHCDVLSLHCPADRADEGTAQRNVAEAAQAVGVRDQLRPRAAGQRGGGRGCPERRSLRGLWHGCAFHRASPGGESPARGEELHHHAARRLGHARGPQAAVADRGRQHPGVSGSQSAEPNLLTRSARCRYHRGRCDHFWRCSQSWAPWHALLLHWLQRRLFACCRPRRTRSLGEDPC